MVQVNEAENITVKNHMGLVIIQATLFSPTSLSDFDDYLSAGYIGLLQAIRNFDVNRGIAFSTYAVTCIRREIIREFKLDQKPRKSFKKLEFAINNKAEEDANNWFEILPDCLSDTELKILQMK